MASELLTTSKKAIDDYVQSLNQLLITDLASNQEYSDLMDQAKIFTARYRELENKEHGIVSDS